MRCLFEIVSQMKPQIDYEVDRSSNSDCSTDLGEPERRKIRKIFEEWMNSSIRNQVTDFHSKRCARAHWLVEYDHEKVRIVREWVHKTSQRGGSTCGSHREKQFADVSSHNKQVPNGFSANHCQIGDRRSIFRFCGRQSVLDWMKRAECEKRRELQQLKDRQSVSRFAQRNRIKNLLRGKFLRSGSLTQNQRDSSTESELGLLRKRQAVTFLREEIFSKFGSFIHGPVSSAQSDGSFKSGMNGYTSNHAYGNSRYVFINGSNRCPSEPVHEERNISGLHVSASKGSGLGEIYTLKYNSQEKTAMGQNLEHDKTKRHPSSVAISVDGSDGSWFGHEDWKEPSFHQFVDGREDSGHYGNRRLQGSISDEESRETLTAEGDGQGHTLELVDDFYEQFTSYINKRDLHDVVGHSGTIEGYAVEDFTGQDLPARLEEWPECTTENTESSGLPVEGVVFGEWAHNIGEVNRGNTSKSTVSRDHQWYEETLGEYCVDDNRIKQPYRNWRENHLRNASDYRIDRCSMKEAAVRRFDSFHFPDDDNERSAELRQLLGRTQVPNLLRSGFRQCLERVMQSYVERQVHGSVDWELGTKSYYPLLVEKDQEQTLGGKDAVQLNKNLRNPFIYPPNSAFAERPKRWDFSDAWTGIDIGQQPQMNMVEIIDAMRTAMAQLQQRMDTMQGMLATFMDMQIQLQKQVQQEASAAFNSSAGSVGYVHKT